jgi:hypothetical protein
MVACLHPAALQRALYFTREDEMYTIEVCANVVVETGITTLNKAGMDRVWVEDEIVFFRRSRVGQSSTYCTITAV